jgi:hypothetical protein
MAVKEISEDKALVTVEFDDWDYTHSYDLAAVDEESAFAVAKEAMENDLRPREVRSVTVKVWGSDVKFEFDRLELRSDGQ